MGVINWILSNWPALASIVAMILSVGVAIAHLLHAEKLALTLQSIEETVNKLNPPKA